jgi:hypothetical protein
MRSINTHIFYSVNYLPISILRLKTRRKSDFSFTIFNITNMCLINTIGIIFFTQQKYILKKAQNISCFAVNISIRAFPPILNKGNYH